VSCAIGSDEVDMERLGVGVATGEVLDVIDPVGCDIIVGADVGVVAVGVALGVGVLESGGDGSVVRVGGVEEDVVFEEDVNAELPS